MWRSKKYFEGLIAKSLYEPLTVRERKQLDNALAKDSTLAEIAVSLKSMMAQLPDDAELIAPDLLPDLRIAIAGEETESVWQGPYGLRSRWTAAALVVGVGVPGMLLLMMLGPMAGPIDNVEMVEAPALSIMQQALRESEELVQEHQYGEALRLLETALVAQSADPDVAKARLMLADLSFGEGLYRSALNAYSVIQSAHPEYVGSLDDDARVRIAERVELLDECRVDEFDLLMAYDAALREGDGRFESLEHVAARAAADPHGLLAGRVLWAMVETSSEPDSLADADGRVAALERVRDRCSNPVVAARASFEAGHTYEREVGDTVRAAEAYRLAGQHPDYEAAAATAIARLEIR